MDTLTYTVYIIMYYLYVVIIGRPLQRMVCGMILAGIAFMLAGFVQLRVEVNICML